jgi:hypothetical protein
VSARAGDVDPSVENLPSPSILTFFASSTQDISRSLSTTRAALRKVTNKSKECKEILNMKNEQVQNNKLLQSCRYIIA